MKAGRQLKLRFASSRGPGRLGVQMFTSQSVRKVNKATMRARRVISIETKRCCNCGKTLRYKSDHFPVNEKEVVCSACWSAPPVNASNSATQPILSVVQFPDK